jgi:hypothetical protein
MLELNVLDALVAAGEVLAFVSLIYFFFLVVRYGELFHHTGHEGDTRPLREAGRGARKAACCGEPEHGMPAHAPGVLDGIAARLVANTVPQRYRDSA